MDNDTIILKINDTLNNNYLAFIKSLQGLSDKTLIEKAPEIGASMLIFTEMQVYTRDSDCNIEHLRSLLKFDNLLDVLRDQWYKSKLLWDEDIETVVEEAAAMDGNEEFTEPQQDGGITLC